MEAKYNFQCSNDKTEITLFDFSPKDKISFDYFIANNNFEQLFYFLENSQENFGGTVFSFIYYSKKIKISYRNIEDSSFYIEKGIPKDGFEQLKQFSIELNKNEIIFPMSYIEKFKKNSLDIKDTDLSVQIYASNELVGHASVIKTTNPLLGDKNLFLLMRFLVHENYRKTDVKEILLKEISDFLPSEAALFLQVFPNNTTAINFFKKRLHVNLAYQKILYKND